jgi:hypothetical protein
MLRTNAKATLLQAVLRSRDLLQVEDLFRRSKAIMRIRPIFHSSDAAIRGNVFCSFLALAKQKHVDDLAREASLVPEWEGALARPRPSVNQAQTLAAAALHSEKTANRPQ